MKWLILFLISLPTALAAPTPSLPSRAAPVPIVAQATSWSCGAASLLGVLYFWNVYDETEKKLYSDLETNRQFGTEPRKIAEVAARFGLESLYRDKLTLKDLKQALADGYTPILDIQAWREEKNKKSWREDWEDGHYVVLVGMDQNYAYFMDPSAHGSYAYLSLPDLLERWHDFEDRHGYREYSIHLAILIRGNRARHAFPDSLVPIL